MFDCERSAFRCLGKMMLIPLMWVDFCCDLENYIRCPYFRLAHSLTPPYLSSSACIIIRAARLYFLSSIPWLLGGRPCSVPHDLTTHWTILLDVVSLILLAALFRQWEWKRCTRGAILGGLFVALLIMLSLLRGDIHAMSCCRGGTDGTCSQIRMILLWHVIGLAVSGSLAWYVMMIPVEQLPGHKTCCPGFPWFTSNPSSKDPNSASVSNTAPTYANEV